MSHIVTMQVRVLVDEDPAKRTAENAGFYAACLMSQLQPIYCEGGTLEVKLLDHKVLKAE